MSNIEFYLIFSYHEWHHLEQMDLGCSLSMCSSVGPAKQKQGIRVRQEVFPKSHSGEKPSKPFPKELQQNSLQKPPIFPKVTLPWLPPPYPGGKRGREGNFTEVLCWIWSWNVQHSRIISFLIHLHPELLPCLIINRIFCGATSVFDVPA